MTNLKLPAIALAFSALCLGLTACGGGGSGGTPSSSGGNDATRSLGGTAATGAPITEATVCLRQAGTAASEPCDQTTTTDADGLFNFDVTELSAPYILTLEGANAGGRPVVLRSATDQAPGEGRSLALNITPLTDSIIAAASDKRAGATGPDDLADGALGDADQALKAAIQDLLSAVGADHLDSLLTGHLETNHTGLDLLLDLLDITTVEHADDTLTVTLAMKGQPDQKRVVDRTSGVLGENTSQSTLTDTRGIEDVARMKLDGIDTLFTAFNNALAAGAGQNALVSDYFHSDFLNGGEAADDYAAFGLEDYQRHDGAVLKGIQIAGCQAKTHLCTVETTWVYDQGAADPITLPVKQQSDGSWVFYGDQRAHGFSLDPYAQRSVDLETGGATDEYGLQLNLDPTDSWNTGVKSAVLYAATEDGGEAEVMRFVQCERSPNWLSHTAEGECAGGYGTNMWALSDEQVSELRDHDGRFRLQLYTDTASTVEAAEGSYASLTLDSPMFADTAFVAFPELTEKSQKALRDLTGSDTTVALTWALGEGSFLSSVNLYLADASSPDHADVDEDTLGVRAERVTLAVPEAVQSFNGFQIKQVRFSTHDTRNRGVFSVYALQPLY